MPPKPSRKNKKPELTPEQLAAEFDKWTKESEEYQVLKEIQSVGTSLNWPNITELYSDLPLKTQPLLDAIMKIGPVFKVKNAKGKPITQEQLRVAWFAGERSRNEAYKIDGVDYQFPEGDIHVDGSKIKSMVYSIWRVAFLLQSIQSDNFEKKRADIIKDFQDLVKAHKKFTKKGKGFFIAKNEDFMIKMLEPLQSLLMSNMGLTVIDFEYPSDTEYEVNNFRYKALIMQFCEAYMRVQTIIFQNPVMDALGTTIVKELKGNPDIYSILKKFQYSHWRLNEVERFYIQPLLDAFLKLRANLSKLYLQGFNYWCIPLIENQQLFLDMSEMQQCEETAEVIMGNRLQREQLNFLYNQVNIIYNSPGRKKLLMNDLRHSKMIMLSIPRLVILKCLEQMHKVYMKKVKEKLEPDPIKRLEIDPPQPLIEFALLSSSSKKPKTHQELLPPGMAYKEKIELANIGEIEIEINDNLITELDKYGRFFIWYDYLPADRHEQMIEAAKILRNVNPAVIQDIEDNIIAQGMEATRFEFQNAQKAAEANRELLNMEKEEQENDVFRNRPPNLWNEPESLLDEHRFKFSSKPELAYKDSRVKDLINHIADLAECLNMKPTKEKWDRLVIRVIQVYQHKSQTE